MKRRVPVWREIHNHKCFGVRICFWIFKLFKCFSCKLEKYLNLIQAIKCFLKQTSRFDLSRKESEVKIYYHARASLSDHTRIRWVSWTSGAIYPFFLLWREVDWKLLFTNKLKPLKKWIEELLMCFESSCMLVHFSRPLELAEARMLSARAYHETLGCDVYER